MGDSGWLSAAAGESQSCTRWLCRWPSEVERLQRTRTARVSSLRLSLVLLRQVAPPALPQSSPAPFELSPAAQATLLASPLVEHRRSTSAALLRLSHLLPSVRAAAHTCVRLSCPRRRLERAVARPGPRRNRGTQSCRLGTRFILAAVLTKPLASMLSSRRCPAATRQHVPLDCLLLDPADLGRRRRESGSSLLFLDQPAHSSLVLLGQILRPEHSIVKQSKPLRL